MPFLGSALGLTAMCSLGWGNLVAFDWNDLPVGRKFDCKFLKKVKSPPHALPPPPRNYIDRCIIPAEACGLQDDVIVLCLASSTTPRRRNLLVALAQYTVTHFWSSSTKSLSWFFSSLIPALSVYCKRSFHGKVESHTKTTATLLIF